MNRKEFITLCGYGLAFLGFRSAFADGVGTAPATGVSAALKPVILPKPQTEGGKPLMQLLQNRRSSREFSSERLSPQVLSNLLWAAFGVNRPDGKRTAPSSRNIQDIDIYVTLPEGAFVYNAPAHRLDPVVSRDLRGLAGTQEFVAAAPLNLIYVGDLTKAGLSSSHAHEYVPVTAGFIGQNVYLFCASEGLATVFRASINTAELGKALNLRPDQKIVYAQTIGHTRNA